MSATFAVRRQKAYLEKLAKRKKADEALAKVALMSVNPPAAPPAPPAEPVNEPAPAPAPAAPASNKQRQGGKANR